MDHTCIIGRYGEIALKGKKTQQQFRSHLRNKIIQVINKLELGNAKVIHRYPRFIISQCEIKKSCKALAKYVPGLSSVSIAIETNSERESIIRTGLKYAEEYFEHNRTFAVKCKRDGKHPYSSRDISTELGNAILTHLSNRNLSVNLSSPDQYIAIDIRQDYAYFYNSVIKGQGGLPIGCQVPLAAIIRNQDDILAAQTIARRGCNFYLIDAKDAKSIDGESDLFILNGRSYRYFIGEMSIQECIKEAEMIARKHRLAGIVIGATDVNLLNYCSVDFPLYMPLFNRFENNIEGK